MVLAVGAKAPDFTLKDQNNQAVRLSEFHGRKAVLLIFYPSTFTGTCLGELTSVQENLELYQSNEVQVLTVSVDSSYSHKVWAMQEGFDFPLLADFWPHGGVASAYGVFDAARGVSGRGTFLIDPAGVVRFAELADASTARDQSGWQRAIAEITGKVG
jgi:peroxiredoxin